MVTPTNRGGSSKIVYNVTLLTGFGSLAPDTRGGLPRLSEKPVRVRSSSARELNGAGVQVVGKSASCSVPIPSSGNITGMPSSIR